MRQRAFERKSGEEKSFKKVEDKKSKGAREEIITNKLIFMKPRPQPYCYIPNAEK